jgi:hypothetical protein
MQKIHNQRAIFPDPFQEIERLRGMVETQYHHIQLVERRLRLAHEQAGLGIETIQAFAALPTGERSSAPEEAADTTGQTGETLPARTADAAPHRRVKAPLPDPAWWPAERKIERALIPTPGLPCFGIGGQTDRVVGISVCGFTRDELSQVIDMIAEQQMRQRDFIPLFLTDSTDFDLFRRYNFVFEYFPSAERRQPTIGAEEWRGYAARRRQMLSRKWGLAHVITFGPRAFGQ